LKRRPGFILQQEDFLWITVKSSDVHQQLDQSKSTTFFHFFPLFLFLEFCFSGTHFIVFVQCSFTTTLILHNIKTYGNNL